MNPKSRDILVPRMLEASRNHEKEGFYKSQAPSALALILYKQTIDDHRERLIKTVLEYNLSGAFIPWSFVNESEEFRNKIISTYWGNKTQLKSYLIDTFQQIRSEYHRLKTQETFQAFFNDWRSHNKIHDFVSRTYDVVTTFIELYGVRETSRAFDIPAFDIINRLNDHLLMPGMNEEAPDPSIYSHRLTEHYISTQMDTWRNCILFLESDVHFILFHHLEDIGRNSNAIHHVHNVLQNERNYLNLILSFGSSEIHTRNRIPDTPLELHADDNANVLVHWPNISIPHVIETLRKNEYPIHVYGELTDPIFHLADDEPDTSEYPIVFPIMLGKLANTIVTPVANPNYQVHEYGFTDQTQWEHWKDLLSEHYPISEEEELQETMSKKLRENYVFQEEISPLGEPLYIFKSND